MGSIDKNITILIMELPYNLFCDNIVNISFLTAHLAQLSRSNLNLTLDREFKFRVGLRVVSLSTALYSNSSQPSLVPA